VRLELPELLGLLGLLETRVLMGQQVQPGLQVLQVQLELRVQQVRLELQVQQEPQV